MQELAGLDEWSENIFIELVITFGENFLIKDLWAKRLRLKYHSNTELLLNQFIAMYYKANSKSKKTFNAIEEIEKSKNRNKELQQTNKFIERLKNDREKNK